MVGVGAGLANGGKIPFVSRRLAASSPRRAMEQIKADVAYSQDNVKLCGHEPRHGLWRARPDPPLHRGPGLAARASPDLT